MNQTWGHDTCAKLLIIFGQFCFGIFLRCQDMVLLSRCIFLIFIFDVHTTPCGLYKYIVDDFIGFSLISLKCENIQTYNFVV